MQTYTYTKIARNGADFAVLAGFLGLVAILYLSINLHPLFVALAVMLSIPAIVEFAQNRRYSLVIDHSEIRWTHSDETQSVPIDQIEQVTVTTRLDLSSRVTIHTRDGAKIRLHPGVTPKGSELMAQFDDRKIPYKRQHFTFTS